MYNEHEKDITNPIKTKNDCNEILHTTIDQNQVCKRKKQYVIISEGVDIYIDVQHDLTLWLNCNSYNQCLAWSFVKNFITFTSLFAS